MLNKGQFTGDFFFDAPTKLPTSSNFLHSDKMSYKFNPMSGRVKAATPPMAYSPEGLKPEVAERSQLIWDQKPKPVARHANPMGGDGIFGKLVRNRVYENQKVFQKLDGVPIHLKKGFSDRVSFSIIMAFTVIGTAWTCYSLYDLSQPKK